VGRDGEGFRSDLGQAASEKFGKTEIFFAEGWAGQISLIRFDKFADARNEATDRRMG
jgi:hypothetical protein